MAEAVIKEIDSQGRISIPSKWRSGWKTKKVLLRKRENIIEIAPIEQTPPSDLFDSITVSNKVDFTNSHSLKRTLMEMREH
ncbi:hypothetical protein KEJ34_04035 [Candidatus Bathyarchaeota archaeon]|nr:hypothetical protein [Candidatus Bathyarchaeota archaeon]